MLSGVFVARVVSFLAAPIIARLFSPEDFGTAATFAMLIFLAGPLSTMMYENAMILESDDQKAICIGLLACTILVGFLCFFTLMMITYDILFFKVRVLEDLGNWKYVLIWGVLLFGTAKILHSWNVRTKQFKSIAGADIGQTLSMVSFRICAGIVHGSSVTGLVFGYLIGIAAKIIIIIKNVNKTLLHSVMNIEKKNYFHIAKEYKEFPLYMTPLRLVKVLSDNLPIMLLAFMYSPEIVGYFAITNRLVRVPADIAQKSVGQTYFQKASEIFNSGKAIKSSLIKTTFGLAVLGMPIFLLVVFFGKVIFTTLLGTNWETAGHYVQILSPWFFTLLLKAPAASVMTIVRKQNVLFFVNLIFLTLKSFVFAAAYLFDFTAEDTLLWYMFFSAFEETFIIFTGLIFSKNKPVRP
ncbi:oligosaccharide flippase family protein [Desulfobacter latus]|uniref:Oligosaccharide flippase family protein n=2 Tax=Desulfobacter latus TaxID=2292 RepID=A0A850SRC6_9BACT|nr:oligosaccharide flippase family protein [Desulfobacter latus]NWH03709.1 oligosaccharide flippase family protein [Desulfobacter latus]